MSKKILKDLILLSTIGGAGYSTPEEAEKPAADEKPIHAAHTKQWHKNRAKEKARREARRKNRK